MKRENVNAAIELSMFHLQLWAITRENSQSDQEQLKLAQCYVQSNIKEKTKNKWGEKEKPIQNIGKTKISDCSPISA